MKQLIKMACDDLRIGDVFEITNKDQQYVYYTLTDYGQWEAARFVELMSLPEFKAYLNRVYA